MADNNEKKQSLFREKSIERIESPEKLNDYLKVTSPGVWLVLSAVILLLAGVCIWGIFGRIEATAPAAVISSEGESVCYVPASAVEGVLSHRTVTVDGEDYTLTPSVLEPLVIGEDTNIYVILAGKLSIGDIVYPVPLETPMETEGIVSGVLVKETLSPMSLFFN